MKSAVIWPLAISIEKANDAACTGFTNVYIREVTNTENFKIQSNIDI